MAPEQARRVHLQQPAGLGDLRGSSGILEDGLGPLRMGDHEPEAVTLRLLADGGEET